jgi:hypothetical protein
MGDWYPTATVRRYKVDGGAMIGGPPRFCLHTTETNVVPKYGDLLGANSAPHFTIHTDGEIFQHQPISRASRSLRNVAGGVQTNRQGKVNVQVEIVGWARNGSTLPAVQMAALRTVYSWARQQAGIPHTFRTISRGSHCYGADSPCRMTTFEWLNFAGVYGHQEAPESTHWDPGNFDMTTIGDDMAFTPGEEAALRQLAAVAPDLVAFVQAVRDAGSNTGGLADFTVRLHRQLDNLYDPSGNN